ncbi:hypothetical protein [Candidatus Mycoplasma haematohominis]|nr:hypothetical protein [Candidatus Mycoplasma haemohominis]
MSITSTQAGVGAATIIASSAITYGIKSASTEKTFTSESHDYGWNKIGYSLKNILATNLISTDASNYELLGKEAKKEWRKRFAGTYAYKSKLRSASFYSLFPEDLFPEAKEHKIDAVGIRKEKAEKEVEQLKENEKVKDKLKKFYGICWKVSRFVKGKKSDSNYYETAALNFISNSDTQLEEKLKRFFRDAWVSCSENGSAMVGKIDKNWPYWNEIENNEKWGGGWYEERDKPI